MFQPACLQENSEVFQEDGATELKLQAKQELHQEL